MSGISLVISDVDGTLVTNDKILTERSCDAARRLDAAGIGFSVVIARPPFGLRMLVAPLALRLPMGAYNGATLIEPDGTILDQRLLQPDAARDAVAVLCSFAVDIWIFSGERWLVADPSGAYVDRETRTVQVSPTVVQRLDDHLDAVSKIVGVSSDFARLTACTPVATSALAGRASVARSQPYYLDITPAGTDKGVALLAIAKRAGIAVTATAAIGDMENDVAMFRQSGFSVAMGNASSAVKSLADAVALSNEENGFADAVERLILLRASVPNASSPAAVLRNDV